MTSDGILLNNAISNFDLSDLGEGGRGSRSANQGFCGLSFTSQWDECWSTPPNWVLEWDLLQKIADVCVLMFHEDPSSLFGSELCLPLI